MTLPNEIASGITYVKVKDTNSKRLAFMADNFYDNPSSKLNWLELLEQMEKQPLHHLLYQLFKKAGYKVGLLSTVKILVDDVEYKATHTTPDSLTINYYLNEMIEAGL